MGEIQMGTTVLDIRRWIKAAPKNTTHMLVVCDTFDHSYYPVYVSDSESVKEKYMGKHNRNMEYVREVYNLGMDIESQLADGIVHNW